MSCININNMRKRFLGLSVTVVRNQITDNSRTVNSYRKSGVLRRFSSGAKPVTLFLNSGRLNYDGALNYSRLNQVSDLITIDKDMIYDDNEISHLIQTHQPEILITKEMTIPDIVFERMCMEPKLCNNTLKLICEAGTGYNNIPTSLCRSKLNISVCNIPTYSTESVAHMVITYIMTFSAAIFDQARKLHQNDQSNFYKFQHPIYEITDKTLGMIGGSGTIGTAVADIAIPLGMNILIASRSTSLPPGHKYEHHPKVKVAPLDYVLSHSDFVSINCPLNAQTYHSIGAEHIRMMKPTAFLINTARGAIIHEQELIECMKQRVIAGAGLDTQEVEPPLPDSELWRLDNVFMTPHIGWRRLETRQRLVDMTADNIQAYVNQQLINVVN